MRYWMLVLSSSFILAGCSKPSITYNELLKFWTEEENGLCQHRVQESIRITLCYKPVDLIIAQNYKTDLQLGNVNFDSLKKSMGQFFYFTLELSKAGKDMETFFAQYPAEHSQALSYLDWGMRKNIKLFSSGSQYPTQVSDYAHVNMYGTTGSTKVIFAFNKAAIKDDDFTVVFQDEKLGFGSCSFTFSKKTIDKIPNLNLSAL